jgi:hypothetical protein
VGQFSRIQIMGGQSDSVVAGKKRFDLTYEDENGKRVPLTSFENMDDMQLYMSMKDAEGRDLYSTNASYRKTIEEIVANSPALLADNGLARRDVIPTNDEMLEGMRQDAVMQQHERYIDAAGGNDLVLKYQYAEAMLNPTPEQHAAFSEIQERTEPARPYENFLKANKASGLGPVQFSTPTEDVDLIAQLEAEHNARILADMGDVNIEMGE